MQLSGDRLGCSYSGHNARQAFHKRFFHVVSHHCFVLIAEERPKTISCHDALPCHIGRDLGRNAENAEAPCESEAELAKVNQLPEKNANAAPGDMQ